MNKHLLLIAVQLASCSGSNAEVVVENDSPIVQGKTLAEDIGIETLGGVLTPLLKSGCSIPCTLSQVFSTAEDNQNQITITLIRGTSNMASEAVSLGKFKISGIAPAPRGVPQIKVVFGASKGNIWLSASDPTGESNIQISRVE